MRTPKQTPFSRPGSPSPRLLARRRINTPTARRLILTIGASLALAGCTTLDSTRYVDTSCSAFEPITYSSSKDTPETIKEIRAHNRVYVALCQGQGK